MKLFRLSTLLYVALLSALVACQPVTRRPELPTLIEHKIPTHAAHAGGIAVGSDGALWFVETGTNQIGRITTDGVVTEYPVPTEDAIDPTQGFVGLGPDGAIWFNEDLANKVGRITPAGAITEFALPEGTGGIRQMVAGPDGNLWVTASFVNKIFKLNTAGELLAEYTMPTAESRPVGMVVGPDGAFWFVLNGANAIGRMTLDGAITEYAIPTAESFPIRITVGPDNALWFTMYRANKVGRISLTGEITEFAVPDMGPVGITTGADGAIWFTGYQSTEIGRLTTDGVLTRIAVPTYAAVPYQIVAGPDGNLWFTEQQGNQIGQIKLPADTVQRSVAPSVLLTATVLAEWQMNHPADLAFGFDAVWIPSLRTNSTMRIDPATNQLVTEIKGTGFRAKRALVTADRVWVTGQSNDTVAIDPQTNTVGVAVPGMHTGLAYGFGSIWTTSNNDGLDRVDPATGEIITSIPLGDGVIDCWNEVYIADAAVWVDHCDEGELIKVDPTTNRIVTKLSNEQLISAAKAQATIPTGKGTDFVWRVVAGGLLRTDPTTGAGLTFLPLRREQSGDAWVTVTDDAVWLSGDGQINRVNVATNQIEATYLTYPGITKVGIGFGSVWVIYEFDDRVQRLDIAP